MPENYHEDPTVPPPGKRSGTGTGSILPFLKKSLASNPHAPSPPEDAIIVSQPDPPRPQEPRNRSRP
jgi:hypothetical protein